MLEIKLGVLKHVWKAFSLNDSQPQIVKNHKPGVGLSYVEELQKYMGLTFPQNEYWSLKSAKPEGALHFRRQLHYTFQPLSTQFMQKGYLTSLMSCGSHSLYQRHPKATTRLYCKIMSQMKLNACYCYSNLFCRLRTGTILNHLLQQHYHYFVLN